MTLVNRSPTRGRYAAHRLGLPFRPLSSFTVDGYDVVVNATPVGRDDNAMPFTPDDLGVSAVVVDYAYGAETTPLMKRTRALGKSAIDGFDILTEQACAQFFAMTRLRMPRNLARNILVGD